MTASPAIWMILGALIAGLVVVLGLVVAGSGEPMPLPTAIPRAQASPVSSTPDFAATATADAYKNERVPRISPAEARQAQAAQGALLVDVRGQSFYREHHIAGAINMPLDEMPARLGELPRDRDVILYCS
jgi:ABC-type phosphate transport system auxiliary subunit